MAFKLEFPGAGTGLAEGGGEVNRCGVKLQVSTQTPSINTHTLGKEKESSVSLFLGNFLLPLIFWASDQVSVFPLCLNKQTQV